MSASRWFVSLAAALFFMTGCSGSTLLGSKSTAEKSDAEATRLAQTLDESTSEPDPATTRLPNIQNEADQDAFKELMAELETLRKTDPEAQRELIALVQDGDPALIPSILKIWKARAKLQRQTMPESKPLDELPESQPLITDLDMNKLEDDFQRQRQQEFQIDQRPVEPASARETQLGSNRQASLELPSETGLSDAPGGFDQELAEPAADGGTGQPPIAASQPQPQSQLQPQPTQSWDSYLNQLIAQTEAELAAAGAQGGPAHTEKQVYLRLLYLMAGMNAQALDPIQGVDATEQEFWKNTLWAMSDYFDREGLPEGANRATEAVKRLTMAANRLRDKATLDVNNLAFCKRIMSFGNYERFSGHPNYEFTPGQPVLLYAQVDNFESRLEQDQYRTVLRSTIEIADEQGRPVWQQEFAPTVDLCQDRRSDFFLTFGGAGNLRIPAKLQPGAYVLRLVVEDELAGKSGTGSISFRVK